MQFILFDNILHTPFPLKSELAHFAPVNVREKEGEKEKKEMPPIHQHLKSKTIAPHSLNPSLIRPTINPLIF